MQQLELIQEPADADVRQAFQEMESGFGVVPNLFRTAAHHPPLLLANWHKLKALMMQGALSRELKEGIALVVSADNGCDYCVVHHSAALQGLGVADETVETIRTEPGQADFSAKESALIVLAREANRAPHDDASALVEQARRAGATDAEIVEALGVMEVFVAFNRFLDFLDVPLEG